MLKKLFMTLLLTSMVLQFGVFTAFASIEPKIETKQWTFSLSNIVHRAKLLHGHTLYISEGPVTLTMTGDNFSGSISYYAEAEIDSNKFNPKSNEEKIEFKDQSIILDRLGYYRVVFIFEGIRSTASSISFIIQVTNAELFHPSPLDIEINNEPEMAEFDLVNEDSGFKLRVPDFVKMQPVSGTHEEIGQFETSWV